MEEKSIFKRDIEADMLKWMERREAYAIKGPRQSGKTTLLRIMEGILRGKGGNTAFLDFEDLDALEAFEGFRSFIEAYDTKKALVITKDLFGKAEVGNATVLFAPAHYL